MTNPTTITAEPGTPFIDITREFDAPAEKVFRCYTDPELVVQWLGPRRLKMSIEEFDVRPGGSYRYIHRDDEGEYAFRGVFHTVEQNRQIIQTFEFEGAPGQVAIETLTLEDLGGRTRLSTRSVFPSVEARDAMTESGMEVGVNEGYDQLTELLEKL